MALAHRLNRLERSLGITGPCPRCRDRGVLRMTFDDEPVPEGCSECGRLTHIHMTTETESEVEAIRAQNWGEIEMER